MPDERQDSIRQGIHPPEESPSGQAAEEERLEKAASGPAVGGGMGGTSDANRPADDAQEDAARNAEDADDRLPERYRDVPGERDLG